MFSEKQGLGECEMMERGVVEPGFLLAPPTGLSLFPLFLRPVALLLVVTTLSFCQSGIVPSSGEGRGGGGGGEFVEVCWLVGWAVAVARGAVASGARAKPWGATRWQPPCGTLRRWQTLNRPHPPNQGGDEGYSR